MRCVATLTRSLRSSAPKLVLWPWGVNPHGSSSYTAQRDRSLCFATRFTTMAMNETTTKIFPYLERLLDGEEVEWKTLGEVCDRTKGIKITATQMKAMHKSNAPVKIFAGGQTFALADYNDLPQNDIYFFPSIIVKSRGIIEFEYYDKPFSHKSEMWSYHTNSPDVNAKFLYYYLKTREDYFQQLGSVMQMPQISIPTTEKFPIPLPPLRVQARIVEILDKFTQLEAQLEAELQAELEARRKQYAYYRDRNLNFLQYPPPKR